MRRILLTKHDGIFLGPIAALLGLVMNAIYASMYGVFGIENIGLSIILFTFIIHIFMLPLTIKQQKFSKLQAKMNPEIQKIQKKYKGKKDQDSMMKMNEETKAVYAKYGVSQAGSCIQLLIQMPILFALYRVIINMPAYVNHIKNAYLGLANVILHEPPGLSNIFDTPRKFITEYGIANAMPAAKHDYSKVETIIDVLYKFKEETWVEFAEKVSGNSYFSDLILGVAHNVEKMNNFIGINIANNPINMLSSGWEKQDFLLIIAAISIPILSGVTQYINTKLMPMASQNASNNGEKGGMESTMKTMNAVMPVMSAVFCLSFPAGMGIYWIAGSVVRSIQQVAVNKYLNSIDLDQLMNKNVEKVNQKRAKKGLPPQKISIAAKQNVKSIEEPKKKVVTNNVSNKPKEDEPKLNSIAAKANMVQRYNDRNKK